MEAVFKREKFIGITAHYFGERTSKLRSRALDVIPFTEADETGQNLATVVKDCLEKWSIFENVDHIIMDGDLEMKAMVVTHLKKKKFSMCCAYAESRREAYYLRITRRGHSFGAY